MPVIIVDGEELPGKAGTNVLEALLSAGVDMPYFCWHPAMGSVGACRQCALLQYANDEDTQGKLVMACMTPVTDGARFSVSTEKAADFRRSVIENLMLNHPHDCPVCEEGGECHLQDMTVMVGHRDRRYQGRKTTFNNQYLGPFIGHEMNRCITCYRCVRFYQDYAGGNDLNAFGSRDRIFFGRAEPGILENEFAGNLVEVCPTGVFTDKTLAKEYTRKWDLQSSPTICQGCAIGCNTYTSERYGKVRRVHNRYHQDINGYFLCDRGRFGAQHVNSPARILQAGIRNELGTYDPLPIDDAKAKVRIYMQESARVIGIGSPRASLEANQALRQLVGAENYSNGMNQQEQAMHQLILEVLASGMNTPTLAEVATFDTILVLGEDATNHAPMLALSIRQAVRNRSKEMAGDTAIAEWHDAAVRELAQAALSPLVIATPMPDRLDDVASQSLRLTPDEILAFSVAVSEQLSAEPGSASTESQASHVAQLLRAAKRPLVVSGTSLGELNVMQAAVNLSLALQAVNPAAGLLLVADECNSIGVAMLDNSHAVEALLDPAPDTMILLENDLEAHLGAEFAPKMSAIKHLVVLDYLDNTSVSMADVLLPAASFAEAEGTFVNFEGRAQRNLAVFLPPGDVAPSYHLLKTFDDDALDSNPFNHSRDSSHDPSRVSSRDEKEKEKVASAASSSVEAIIESIMDECPPLKRIAECAPDAGFRVLGSKLPRMTHRASGRTAMQSQVSVHEPKQPVDRESALAFTMEGNQQQAPASLRTYAWSPGWNSNQSIYKFQTEVGGADTMGNPGVRLLSGDELPSPYTLAPATPAPYRSNLRFIAQHHIFGSDPVTRHAQELATRIPAPYARMHTKTATALGLSAGDGLACQLPDKKIELNVILDDEVATHCLVYPKIEQTRGLADATPEHLQLIPGWQGGPKDPLRPELILTDRSG